MKTAMDLLVDDVAGLVTAWAPDVKNNYRAKFEKGGKESVRKMLVGLGPLSRGELAGERLEVALNSQDQEDEHSCFSDDTHRDASTNAKGIQNVWLGSYKRVDGSVVSGPSLKDLVAVSDTALADKTSAQMAASEAKAEAIQAEHDDPAQKTAAPLLAMLDWTGLPEGELRLAHGQPALSGYGGDITVAGQGNTARFVVSATRGGMLSLPESSPSDPGLPAASGVRPWSGGKVDNHWLRV